MDLKPWPTLADCEDRLGLVPAEDSDTRALQASLDATIAYVKRCRPDLALVDEVPPDEWQGVVILTVVDYRAGNSPSGFAGYDGGISGDNNTEKWRGQQLLRIDRFQVPRVG